MVRRYKTKASEKRALKRAYSTLNNLWTWSPNVISDADFIAIKKIIDRNLKRLG